MGTHNTEHVYVRDTNENVLDDVLRALVHHAVKCEGDTLSSETYGISNDGVIESNSWQLSNIIANLPENTLKKPYAVKVTNIITIYEI